MIGWFWNQSNIQTMIMITSKSMSVWGSSYNPKYKICWLWLWAMQNMLGYHWKPFNLSLCCFCFPKEYLSVNGSYHPQWDKYDWIMEDEIEYK